jgi:hypothetical protein
MTAAERTGLIQLEERSAVLQHLFVVTVFMFTMVVTLLRLFVMLKYLYHVLSINRLLLVLPAHHSYSSFFCQD